ncbi:Auxin-induced protein 5NG4 [Hordeum vulgare]|nr:Auxin-induced protein 5NG4 [Hordeum vulgare]
MPIYMPLFLSHSPPKPDPFSPNSNTQATEPSILSENPKHQVKMQYNTPTCNRPHVVPELLYRPGVFVENELHVWATSRWRGPVKLTRAFLREGYAHLPQGSPRMFTLNEVRDHVGTLLLLTTTFAKHFDVRELLGRVYWCGCESIFFTVYNIFTNYECIFPTKNQMHSLPYEEEEY